MGIPHSHPLNHPQIMATISPHHKDLTVDKAGRFGIPGHSVDLY